MPEPWLPHDGRTAARAISGNGVPVCHDFSPRHPIHPPVPVPVRHQSGGIRLRAHGAGGGSPASTAAASPLSASRRCMAGTPLGTTRAGAGTAAVRAGLRLWKSAAAARAGIPSAAFGLAAGIPCPRHPGELPAARLCATWLESRGSVARTTRCQATRTVCRGSRARMAAIFPRSTAAARQGAISATAAAAISARDGKCRARPYVVARLLPASAVSVSGVHTARSRRTVGSREK